MATPTQRRFSITGAGDTPLHGIVRTSGPNRPAVVLCPDLPHPEDEGFLEPLTARLARGGFCAVTCDFPGGAPSLDDLVIVLNALTSDAIGEHPPAVGLLGHGAGGALAIVAAASDESSVRALVTWGAPATLSDALGRAAPLVTRAAGLVRVPWLLVHGTADDSVPRQAAEVLHAAAERAIVERLTLPGADHHFGWRRGAGGHSPRALDATVAWFSRHLGA